MNRFMKHGRYCLVEIDAAVRSSEFRILKKVIVTIFETKGMQVRARSANGTAYTCINGTWRERSDGTDGRAWIPIEMGDLIRIALERRHSIVEKPHLPLFSEELAA
jgi:hypothetical protein